MTAQQDSRQPIDSLVSVKYSSARACDSSTRFKTMSKQFSWSKVILHSVQLELVKIQQDSRQAMDVQLRHKITLHTAQPEPVTVQQHSKQQ